MFKLILFLLISKDTLFVFYSPYCPHCINSVKIVKNLNIPFKLLNLEDDSIMLYLDSLESSLGVHKDEIPVFYYKGKLYYGSLPGMVPKDNTKSLPFSKNECRNCEHPIEKNLFKKGKIYFVYTPGCRECSRFARQLDKLQKELRLEIQDVSSFDSLGLSIIHSLKDAKLYKKPPFLLIGDTVLYTLPHDKKEFLGIIKRHSRKAFNINAERKELKFTLPATIIAGLIDGINPCAFTVLLFLIGFLAYKKRRKKESFLILIFFSLGIFIAYFSIGIGLYGILDFINRIKPIEFALRLLIGIFAIILGVITLKDGILMVKTGKTNIGGLSLEEKQKTHAIIRKYIDRGIFAGSFLMGLSISFVEFACTGQIYLPTLSYISRHEGMTLTRLAFLLIYNICFLIPLIIIGLLAILIEHKRVSKRLNKNTPSIKFATSLLFFGLGVLVIFF